MGWQGLKVGWQGLKVGWQGFKVGWQGFKVDFECDSAQVMYCVKAYTVKIDLRAGELLFLHVCLRCVCPTAVKSQHMHVC